MMVEFHVSAQLGKGDHGVERRCRYFGCRFLAAESGLSVAYASLPSCGPHLSG
jgi:hypothetical protein